MHRRLLVSGLPRSLPPLPASPAPPCLPCVEGRQRAAPHSSSFPPTEAPLQTLHLDVWGPARVRGQGGERYFLLVVDDYSHYTTVFPLRTKGEVPAILIPWIRAVRLQLRRKFQSDLPVLRLHSDRGGEFSSDLLRAFCKGEGILQPFTLPGSPQQNGVAERRIGLVMEIARTSLIHAAAPHFLWPFAVRYAAHQLNLWPHVSLPDTSPTLRWTGEVGDASRFRVWGARALVRDTSADKLSSHTIPCVFLGFVPDAPGWQFYHPTSRRVFPSQDVTFDESVPFYRLFPDCTTPLPPPPLFLAPGPPLPMGEVLGGAEPGGAEPASAEPGGAELEGTGSEGAESAGVPPGRPLSAAGAAGASGRGDVGSTGVSGCGRARTWGTGAARTGGTAGAGGASSGGAESPGGPPGAASRAAGGTGAVDSGAGGTGSGGAAAGGTGAGGPGAGAVDSGVGDPGDGGAGSGGAATGGTGAGGAGSGGAAAGGTEAGDPGAGGAGSGGAAAGGTGVRGPGAGGAGSGGAATGGTEAGDPGAGGSCAAGGAGAGSFGAARGAGAGDSGAAGGDGAGGSGAAGGAGAGGYGAAGGAEAGGSGAAGGAGAGKSGAVGSAGATGAGDTAQPRLFFAPPSPSSLPPPDSVLRQVLSLPSSTGLPLQPGSPLPAPSPYTEQTDSLTKRCEPASRPASPVRARHTRRRVPRERSPPVPSTHAMALRPSSVPQRVPLPSPPASSLPDVPDPESDLVRAAHPTVTRLLATVVTDPSFESAAASALVSELVDFAAACCLDYAASLVAKSESVCPPSVEGECALGTDVLEDTQEDFECLAAAAPHLVAMLLAPEGDPDALDIPTPRSYAEAIAGPYSSQWQAAMDAEMASSKSTGTYVDEVPPPGANIVDGIQREGVDFFQTFSPTPKMTTLRVLLHVAAQRDYELHSLDFSTAFLQGSLHEEIWLRRPPGFTGSFPPGTQWSLRRPVYGLRQAPREWHDTLRTTLAALGFAPSTADPSLFLRTDTSLPPFYILVYVDDLVFATADTEALALVKSELQKRHTCTDVGELRSSLGLQIIRDRARRTITLTQSHMVQHVLQRFGFTWSSPQSTPMATGHSLSALPSDESVEPTGPYPELVGCLMYLMTCTRPDLAYPLSILARYVAPGRHRREHWEAAKRVLRYLCSTSGMGLVLGGRGDVVLTGHSDASWVDDLATQRSSQGYTFSLGSGLVSWQSTRSSSVLSSNCEAEIYATAMAAQELRWLTYMLTDLGERPSSPPVLYVDNKAAIALC
ncbi:unnamed protein product [Closterium sp. Yama58-4]|nr:unnamed protein product [Closterium sp. Yama58-4]